MWFLLEYISNSQIHEDLGVPDLADHIRTLTESFDSKLADAGNRLVHQLGRYLRWPRAGLTQLTRKLRVTMASRPVQVARKAVAKSTKRIVPNTAQLGTFRLPWLRFFRDVSSVVRRMPWYNVWSKYGARPAFPLRYSGITKVPVYSRALRSCDYATLGSNPRKPSNQKYDLPYICG